MLIFHGENYNNSLHCSLQPTANANGVAKLIWPWPYGDKK